MSQEKEIIVGGQAVIEGVMINWYGQQGTNGDVANLLTNSNAIVAKTDDFKAFCQDVCLQIAATSPTCVRREDVPEADLAKERDIAMAQLAGKPAAAVQKIVEGKLDKYYSQVCLLEQPFIKDDKITIKDLIANDSKGRDGERAPLTAGDILILVRRASPSPPEMCNVIRYTFPRRWDHD